MRATLCLVFLSVFACAEIRAQSFQKLLDGAKSAPSTQKTQPSAAEQKDWAAERVSQFQAKESALNSDELRGELRTANLPETRAEEFLSAAREIVRNYQLAVDTLTAVLNKEAQQLSAASSESIPLPKDDAEADALRDKLSGQRTQAQTVSMQVQIDEEFLARQQSALKAAGQQLRRAQEEFDASNTDATRNRAALQLRLAELQQEAASSAGFLASWRLYADELDLRASQTEVRAIEQALSASGLDTVFNEKRTKAAIGRIEKEKASVLEQIKSAQSARQVLDDAIAPLEQDLQKVSDAEDRKRLEARLAIAREANDFANRIATAGQAWLEGLDEALRLWKATLAVAENPGPAAYLNARKLADHLLAQSDPWG